MSVSLCLFQMGEGRAWGHSDHVKIGYVCVSDWMDGMEQYYYLRQFGYVYVSDWVERGHVVVWGSACQTGYACVSGWMGGMQ